MIAVVLLWAGLVAAMVGTLIVWPLLLCVGLTVALLAGCAIVDRMEA